VKDLVLRDPAFLWGALLVPLALWAGGRRPRLRFSPAALWAKEPLPRSWRVRLRLVPALLLVLGLGAGFFALARPASRVALPRSQEGIDVLLVLDVSSSMAARDLDPRRTRLEVARDAAARFVGARPDDRIGLVAFARYPDLLCPPTLDHAALLGILAAVSPVEADGPEDATGIGAAVARAAEVLSRGRSRSRVAILLTDGEENVALAGLGGEIPPAQAAQLAEALGVRVFPIVAGVGRASASGAWKPLDTRAVEALARRTGGTFHEARDAGTLDAVYARIDALVKSPVRTPRFVFQDRHPPFVLAAILLVALAALLAATVWERLP
jgi:Ca-activated chloride channel family protein